METEINASWFDCVTKCGNEKGFGTNCDLLISAIVKWQNNFLNLLKLLFRHFNGASVANLVSFGLVIKLLRSFPKNLSRMTIWVQEACKLRPIYQVSVMFLHRAVSGDLLTGDTNRLRYTFYSSKNDNKKNRYKYISRTCEHLWKWTSTSVCPHSCSKPFPLSWILLKVMGWYSRNSHRSL